MNFCRANSKNQHRMYVSINKVASSGFSVTHNIESWFTSGSDRLLIPTVRKHGMCWPVSDFQILIKSCSIESRNDPSQKVKWCIETKFSLKISYSTHACLAQLDQHQTLHKVVGTSDGQCCEFKSHWRQLNFLTNCSTANFVQKWQKLLVLFTKNLVRVTSNLMGMDAKRESVEPIASIKVFLN